jgi:hypothetical protein
MHFGLDLFTKLAFQGFKVMSCFHERIRLDITVSKNIIKLFVVYGDVYEALFYVFKRVLEIYNLINRQILILYFFFYKQVLEENPHLQY